MSFDAPSASTGLSAVVPTSPPMTGNRLGLRAAIAIEGRPDAGYPWAGLGLHDRTASGRRCPIEVKRYPAPFDLSEATRNYFSHTGLARAEIAEKLKVLYGGMSQWENSLFKMPRLKTNQVNLGAGTASEELNTGDPWGFGQIQIWSLNDIKRPIWRIIIFVLFWTGLFLVGFPAAVTFLQVTLVAASHLIAQRIA